MCTKLAAQTTYSNIFTVEHITVDQVDPELSRFFVQLTEYVDQIQSHVHLFIK